MTVWLYSHYGQDLPHLPVRCPRGTLCAAVAHYGLNRRDYEQLLGTTAETVMLTCFEGPDIDAKKDARHIRCIDEAWSLWHLVTQHEWRYADNDPTPDPD